MFSVKKSNHFLFRFAVIFLVLFFIVASALAATEKKSYSYIRIFYYRDGLLAKESLFSHAGSIDVLAPQSYSLDSSGKMLGSVNAGVLAFASKNNIKIMPLVTNGNFSKEVYQPILDDSEKQDLAITSLVEEAKKKGYWGWQLDFEQMDVSYKEKYSAFVDRAAKVLNKNNLVLSIAVIAQVSNNPQDYPNDLWQKTIGVYDYSSLAASVDFISLMSYDDPESVGPVVEYPWLKRVLDYSIKLIPKEKLSLGVPLYYWQWNNMTGARIGIGGRKGIYNVFNKYKVSTYYDNNLEAAYLRYWYRTKEYVIWYENERSLAKKIELIKQNQLHGFSAWALGLELPSIFNAMKN